MCVSNTDKSTGKSVTVGDPVPIVAHFCPVANEIKSGGAQTCVCWNDSRESQPLNLEDVIRKANRARKAERDFQLEQSRADDLSAQVKLLTIKLRNALAAPNQAPGLGQ